MPTFDELKNTYFVQVEDETPPSEMMPLTFSGCQITPIIDGAKYNDEIDAALATVGTGGSEAANANHFIFISSWWLGLLGGQWRGVTSLLNSSGPEVKQIASSTPYVLDPPAGTKVLIDILKAKADAGVDVRVLPWISFAVMDSNIAQKSGAGSFARVNALSMESVKELRTHPKLAKKVVLNVIGHTAGSVHVKMVVIGNDTNAVGFTGGIDFEMTRVTRPGHAGNEIWHDVQAKVEGEAVQAMYDYFMRMWQENVGRPAKRFRFEGADMPSFVPGTPVLPARTLTIADTGTKHHVQSIRTVPQFKYKWYNCLPENDPISFAPDGIFEYKLALRKAMRAATTYIYLEDQSYWGQEILSWANEAIKNHPDVKVILLFSGAVDPVDGAIEDAPNLTQSINHGLLKGLTAAQRDRVRLVRAFGDINVLANETGGPATIDFVEVTDEGDNALLKTIINATKAVRENAFAGESLIVVNEADTTLVFDVIGNPPIAKDTPLIWRVAKRGGPVPPTGRYILVQKTGVFVHAKTVLVDDHWAVIGSGNIMRRGLYSDLEHGVSFMDEDGNAVRDYRCQLWADHFRHPTPADFADIGSALHAWEPTWGPPGPVPTPSPFLQVIPIPIREVAFTEEQRTKYDTYMDLDSREEWGGLSP